jgi:hypothetical protein
MVVIAFAARVTKCSPLEENSSIRRTAKTTRDVGFKGFAQVLP